MTSTPQRRTGSRLRTAAAFLVGTVALFPAASGAGVVIEVETRKPAAGSQATLHGQALIEGRLLRFDEKVEEPETSMIFDGESATLWTIDHTEKSYFAIEAETFKHMMSQVDGQLRAAMAQLEEHLADLPAERREEMRRMMESRMPQIAGQAGARTPPMEIRPAASTRTIGGHTCRRYDVYRGREKVREIWATDWSSVGLAADTFAVFEDFGKFFESMLAAVPQQAAQRQQNPFSEIYEVGGFPLLLKSFEAGTVEEEVHLRVLEIKDLGPEPFQAPPGYSHTNPFAQFPQN